MADIPDAPRVSNNLFTGEYGATKVEVSKDGSMTRIAFGRKGGADGIYYVAVLLSPEAMEDLKSQLDAD